MLHRYDDISLFMPLFNIPVSLDNLFQRISSVDDRFYLTRLNQFFEEDQILDISASGHHCKVVQQPVSAFCMRTSPAVTVVA